MRRARTSSFVGLALGVMLAPPIAEAGQAAPGQGRFIEAALQQSLQTALGQSPRAETRASDTPLTLQAALEQARANGQALRAAMTNAELAAEERTQARAALLPSLSGFAQHIYTQSNGTPSGVFVANSGPHVYNVWGTVHGDLLVPSKWADYRTAQAAEVAARARADVAARGLTTSVVQAYYSLVAATRKAGHAQQSLTDARQFLDLSQRLERGGEVAHSDVVKAQIDAAQRERDARDAALAVTKSRLLLAVLVFPDFRDNYTVVDDLQTPPPLPDLQTVRSQAARENPDVRAAEAALRQESSGITSARSAFLPTLSFDYFYGINANQFAITGPDGQRLLGSVAQAQMTVPLWNWGATRSKVRQAELRTDQARADVSFTARQLLANVSGFHAEAEAAYAALDSLRTSVDLSIESLRLTLLRYQSGEATVLEVIDARSTLAQARNAYDDGLVRYRLALAALQTLTGTL